jgi:hypothetical protein
MAMHWLIQCKTCTGWTLVTDTRDIFFQQTEKGKWKSFSEFLGAPGNSFPVELVALAFGFGGAGVGSGRALFLYGPRPEPTDIVPVGLESPKFQLPNFGQKSTVKTKAIPIVERIDE